MPLWLFFVLIIGSAVTGSAIGAAAIFAIVLCSFDKPKRSRRR